ncbi:MAG: HEAT repeat domain-containing protein [Polyangiaceae bacterium]|nr:HEAT repeat domain-containing protein [Polyangiaceae bacterium]
MRSLPFVLAIATAACTPAAQPTNTPVSETTAGAAQKPCPETTEATTAQKDEVDQDILALAATAQKCNFEHGSFDYDCAGYKEWRDAGDDLFEGPSGNSTILSMLEDKDIRARTLATQRGFTGARSYFSDPKHGARLLAVIDKEREERLFYYYGRFAAYINGEKTLGKELRALANHPATNFRQSFAENALPTHPNEFSLGLVKVFLDDPDDSVRRAAIRSLSASGRTRPTEGICALLKTQIARTDKLAIDALIAGRRASARAWPTSSWPRSRSAPQTRPPPEPRARPTTPTRCLRSAGVARRPKS